MLVTDIERLVELQPDSAAKLIRLNQVAREQIEPPAGDELKVLIFDAEGAPIIGDTV